MLKKCRYLLLSVVAVAAMVATVTLGANVLDQATASVGGRLSYSTTLKAPTIWSPGSKAVLINYPRTTSLSWSYVTGATSYEIEVGCDTCVSSTTLYSSPTTYTSYYNYYTTPALAGDNTFRFKVRAKNASSTGEWSDYRYFSYSTPAD